MPEPSLDQRIEAVRRFSRFYTRKIGVLREGLHDSAFSLAQSRVLYELAHRPATAARDLAAELDLDPGYLSRILDGLARQGLIERRPSEEDRRQRLLSLTEAGRTAFAPLDQASKEQIGAMLQTLPEPKQRSLIDAMRMVQTTLEPVPDGNAPYILRPPRPGDYGWIIHRHGVLYAQEYGWNAEFEALVAEIAARIIQNWEPKRECWWVAERDGAILGSVCLVRSDAAAVAKLRLLLVEPAARGQGIGRRLVDECIRFARQAGYAKVTLWTNILTAAHLINRAGFQLVHQEPHHGLRGADLISETWELSLA